MKCRLTQRAKLDNSLACVLNECMIRGYLQQTITVVLLFSQLLLLVIVGNSFIVQCQVANDHLAIELAHINSCDDDSIVFSSDKLDNVNRSLATDQYSVQECIDTSMAQTPVISQEKRASSFSLPVLFAYQVAQLPAFPVHFTQTPVHIFSSDSSKSLAHNVILLI